MSWPRGLKLSGTTLGRSRRHEFGRGVGSNKERLFGVSLKDNVEWVKILGNFQLMWQLKATRPRG